MALAPAPLPVAARGSGPRAAANKSSAPPPAGKSNSRPAIPVGHRGPSLLPLRLALACPLLPAPLKSITSGGGAEGHVAHGQFPLFPSVFKAAPLSALVVLGHGGLNDIEGATTQWDDIQRRLGPRELTPEA
ncbi:unnamed protein product [Urochloa humidicola]